MLLSWGTNGRSAAGIGVPLKRGRSSPSANIGAAAPSFARLPACGSFSPNCGTPGLLCGGSCSPIDASTSDDRSELGRLYHSRFCGVKISLPDRDGSQYLCSGVQEVGGIFLVVV